jgi:hypothetical protein
MACDSFHGVACVLRNEASKLVHSLWKTRYLCALRPELCLQFCSPYAHQSWVSRPDISKWRVSPSCISYVPQILISVLLIHACRDSLWSHPYNIPMHSFSISCFWADNSTGWCRETGKFEVDYEIPPCGQVPSAHAIRTWACIVCMYPRCASCSGKESSSFGSKNCLVIGAWTSERSKNTP